ncbi:MAG: DNA gyrase inhibitor YacG [Nitrosomonas sp.]|nr:MAG: DNA gyrase inhibitor YacG [Nitrosomonas sp.]
MLQRTINCPQCGKKVTWDAVSPWRPFCSERCKINDLAQWAQESYRIPIAESESESEQPNNNEPA